MILYTYTFRAFQQQIVPKSVLELRALLVQNAPQISEGTVPVLHL